MTMSLSRQPGAEDIARAIWLGAARQTFVAREREACCVCGKYRWLTQAHHLVPLTMQYDAGLAVPIQDYAWLCPTHHVAIHLLIANVVAAYERRITPSALQMLGESEPSEIAALFKLVDAFTALYYAAAPGAA